MGMMPVEPENDADRRTEGSLSTLKALTALDVFPKPSDLGPRDWGREVVLGVVSGAFSLKRLEMRAGTRGGLQFHRCKHEVAVLISGTMIVRHVAPSGELTEREVSAGEVVHFAPGVVHQEIAVTDCVLIEASTPHFNDRVRVESEFGEADGKGLPTTVEDQIVAL